MAQLVLMTTFHKALSYGGCLQAYATFRVIKNLGYDVRVIDFENPYEARKKTLSSLLGKGTSQEIVATLVKDVFFKGSQYRKSAFGDFCSCLPLTENTYASTCEMEDVRADVFVVGSDQVWNPEITNGLEPAFFLDFGVARKRVSLSSSMGSHIPSEDELRQMTRYLARFTSISVREEFARARLAPGSRKDVRVTLDPTLLVEPEEWRRFAVEPSGFKVRPYILLFMVANPSTQYVGYLDGISRKTGCEVVQVRLNSNRPKGVSRVIPATPQEFVWLVENASMVFTDSFHGIAFSIGLETPFVFLPNPGNNVRIEELLAFCGLEGRDVRNFESSSTFPPLDFSYSRKLVSKKRSDDLAWLAEALQ